MEKVKNLNKYQKAILFISVALLIIFAGVYYKTVNRVGYSYKDEILVPKKENGNTVYSGKLGSTPVAFTVYTDKTVEYAYGDKTYGPYTATEDPQAIPRDSEQAHMMKGVRLYNGDQIIFRGGMIKTGGRMFLYNSDSTIENIAVHAVTSNGEVIYPDGEPVDKARPKAAVILALMDGPQLTHKGDWGAWFLAAFICVLNTISILFADRLFRWNLAFIIRDTENAQPSDWEIASRYISWTCFAAFELLVLFMGLG